MRKAFTITFFSTFILVGIYFFFLTFISNQNLYFTSILLKNAGNIIVPGNSILSSMLKFKTILFGSFFITFTAGIVISFTLALIVSLFYINKESFLIIVDIFLPIFVSLMLVVTTLFIFDTNQLFSRIRDSFLISNTIGESINDFYYKYTLYGAEALKSPIEKQIKPCWIDPNLNSYSKIKKALFKYGWLTSDKIISNELIIKKNYKSGLDFIHKGELILRVSNNNFLNNPERFLTLFSLELDSKQFLRMLCSIGIMPGIPIIVFFIIYSFVFLLLLGLNTARTSNLVSSTITGILLIGLLFYLNPEVIKKPDSSAVKNMLFSSESYDRIKGLRLFTTGDYEIPDFDHMVSQLLRGEATEKYWLANALGMRKNNENINILKKLINDKSMKVRYAAIHALSEIDPSRKSLKIFKQIINNCNSKNNINSDQWYVQSYAYAAYQACIINTSSK